jgi:hypothetical protein
MLCRRCLGGGDWENKQTVRGKPSEYWTGRIIDSGRGGNDLLFSLCSSKGKYRRSKTQSTSRLGELGVCLSSNPNARNSVEMKSLSLTLLRPRRRCLEGGEGDLRSAIAVPTNVISSVPNSARRATIQLHPFDAWPRRWPGGPSRCVFAVVRSLFSFVSFQITPAYPLREPLKGGAESDAEGHADEYVEQ